MHSSQIMAGHKMLSGSGCFILYLLFSQKNDLQVILTQMPGILYPPFSVQNWIYLLLYNLKSRLFRIDP